VTLERRGLAVVVGVLFGAACGSGAQQRVAASTSSGGIGGAAAVSSSTGTGGATGMPACATPPPGAPVAGSDVTGTMLVRHFIEDGSFTTVPADLSAAQIQALVLANGVWASFPGKGAADGSFVVPGVPQVPYMLEVRGAPGPIASFDRYLLTSERTIDLGYATMGRPDAVTTQQQGLSATLENLDPWVSGDVTGTTGDVLEWQSFGCAGFGLGPFPIAAGATSVQNAEAVWGHGLVDGSKGDVLHVTQLSLQAGNAAPYSVLSRLGSFTGVEMAMGKVTHLDGMLSAPAPTASLAVDLRASQFAALAPAVYPGATTASVPFGVATGPGGGTAGRIGGVLAGLLRVHAGVTDADLGTLQYPPPFSAGWGEWVGLTVTVDASIAVPGSVMPFAAGGVIEIGTTHAKATAGPIVPLVSPVRDPRVNGQSALSPLTGVSTAPTVSWTPPAIGTPAGYALSVLPISGNAPPPAILFLTADTSITLPPCLLAEGDTYYFVITAIVTDGSIAAYPYLSSVEWAVADALTSGVTP
jgi:hypothetical protein